MGSRLWQDGVFEAIDHFVIICNERELYCPRRRVEKFLFDFPLMKQDFPQDSYRKQLVKSNVTGWMKHRGFL